VLDEQPVVKLVTSLLDDAVTSRASDIHVEPHEAGVKVRLRVDGVLREAMELPRSLGRQVTSRLKIMASMDIAERRLPQDGRAAARVNGQPVDLRVSTMPTLYGETVVIRVLPRGADLVSLAELGLSRRLPRPADRRPPAAPGPGAGDRSHRFGQDDHAVRGAGQVSDVTRNVLTLEDPVEVQLPGSTRPRSSRASA
jgi:type IV pilus assembly protein PilB